MRFGSSGRTAVGPYQGVVFILCTTTSALCAWLLLRAFYQSRAALLIWSALCFLLLTLNNLLVFVDVIMLPTIDLGILRLATSLLAAWVLIYGFVWDQ